MYYINESEVSPNKHRTYKIKKGDTLQSVAQELGVDAQELRRYHNIYCEIPDLIEADFKSHLELVILAPEKSVISKDEIIEKKPQKVSFGDNYKLLFLPRNIQKEYQVQYTTEVGEEIDILEIEIVVKWLASDEKGFHLFEIIRGQEIYINTKKPETIMDELDAKTAEILYPLKIVVDESGKWVDIYNYDEIVTRWKVVKREILDYYDGEVSENHIEIIEYALEDSDTLLKALSSDYFLRAFFNGIYVEYTADFFFEDKVSFPLEKGKESVYNIGQKVTPYVDESGLIKVEQKGEYVDNEFQEIYRHEPFRGNYKAVYYLNEDNYSIEKVNLECSIDGDEFIKATILIEPLKKGKTEIGQ
ncbi:LysM peptidoglycan-binding domain-containing protein [Flavobacterium sp. ANB]|uniref:LysM peptidoglycan-binding domain-containing protein n=1 Tax=unclassified Flavobacterium TaxID=196869 RepID=UPI0012B7A1D8|nr:MULTISPECIES: LysM domain-containing protein [unclassified Flavobacterium]MBF4516818.1 LysM peptidoglycan-binding domain-containing protein [Flavobacterium sp. ANB]MTD69286.1 LysM peptidoglycan-binding domain-containing protein [Flavobacterium sp. LC2016-13]